MDPDYKWIRTVNRFKNLGSGADLAEFTVKNITVFAAEKLYFANFFDFTWAWN